MHRESTTSPDGSIAEVGQTIRAATTNGQKPYSVYCVAPSPAEESVIGLEPLFDSSCRCMLNVGFKYSVQNYVLHGIEKTLELHKDLILHVYKEGKTYIVHITYPKKREALSITFVDRVVQRSFNDNVLYPVMTRPFVYANFACQKGKGTNAAREYYRNMLRKAYITFGRTNEFDIVTIDIKGYYESMVHEITNKMFKDALDEWSGDFVVMTLESQYKGDKGYNPGSQMVQIAGIAYLNKFDHFVKEVLRIKYYVRYMDDIHMLVRCGEAESIIESCRVELAKVGLRMHPTKTRILKASLCPLFYA